MNTPSHHLSEQELWNYYDDPSSFSHFDEHVINCPECKDAIKEMTWLEADVKGLETFEPSMKFTPSVVRRYEASKAHFPWFVYLLAGSFVLIFCLSLYMFLDQEITIDNNSLFIHLCTVIMTITGFMLFAAWNRKVGSRMAGDR